MKKHTNTKKYLLIFLISFVVYLLIAPIRGGSVEIFGLAGFGLSTTIYSLVYFALTIWVLHKNRTKLSVGYMLTAILIGAIGFEMPIRVIYFDSSMVSAMDFTFRIIAIFAGWMFIKLGNKYLRALLTLFIIGLTLWSSTCGMELWLHKRNFGTFSGRVDETIVQPLKFMTEPGDTLQMTTIGAKYVVLDFFTSNCGVCFRKLPKVQALHEKYAENPNVKLFSVHVMGKDETTQSGSKVLADEGYTLPCLSVDRKDEQLSLLGVRLFPTVLIYDTSGKIIFRGSIEHAQGVLNDLMPQ